MLVDDRPLHVTVSADGSLSVSETKRALEKAGLLATPGVGTSRLPLLITSRDLADEEWAHLLSSVTSEYVVISTWNVGASSKLSDETVGRYVATSVALETLAAHAHGKEADLLEDRNPDLERGCLFDFHRTRQTYITQSQHPVLCSEEEDGIRGVFGEDTVTALKAVLKKISGQ